jgi:hypothetical protein
MKGGVFRLMAIMNSLGRNVIPDNLADIQAELPNNPPPRPPTQFFSPLSRSRRYVEAASPPGAAAPPLAPAPPQGLPPIGQVPQGSPLNFVRRKRFQQREQESPIDMYVQVDEDIHEVEDGEEGDVLAQAPALHENQVINNEQVYVVEVYAQPEGQQPHLLLDVVDGVLLDTPMSGITYKKYNETRSYSKDKDFKAQFFWNGKYYVKYRDSTEMTTTKDPSDSLLPIDAISFKKGTKSYTKQDLSKFLFYKPHNLDKVHVFSTCLPNAACKANISQDSGQSITIQFDGCDGSIFSNITVGGSAKPQKEYIKLFNRKYLVRKVGRTKCIKRDGKMMPLKEAKRLSNDKTKKK